MYDRDSNLEKLAGYGLLFARWEIFKFVACIAFTIAGFLLIFGMFFWLFITTPQPTEQQKREADDYLKSYNLSQEECIRQGHYWSAIPVHMNNASWTKFFCTQNKF